MYQVDASPQRERKKGKFRNKGKGIFNSDERILGIYDPIE